MLQLTPLTPAQTRVASLVWRGARSKDIARTIGVAESTVLRHLQNIFRKLHVRNRAELAVWFERQTMTRLVLGSDESADLALNTLTGRISA